MRRMTRESVTKVAVLVLVLWGFWFPVKLYSGVR
jgi:hypothetical protein